MLADSALNAIAVSNHLKQIIVYELYLLSTYNVNGSTESCL